MKKIVKMSLVAAMVMAGLTTTASAFDMSSIEKSASFALVSGSMDAGGSTTTDMGFSAEVVGMTKIDRPGFEKIKVGGGLAFTSIDNTTIIDLKSVVEYGVTPKVSIVGGLNYSMADIDGIDLDSAIGMSVGALYEIKTGLKAGVDITKASYGSNAGDLDITTTNLKVAYSF